MNNGWTGVDLDGTLAYYDGWQGPTNIGDPVPKMLNRVKQWLSEGKDVRIFTARVSINNPERLQAKEAIQDWCIAHLDCKLPITSEKDYYMVELWDDRCIQIIPNTGVALQERYAALLSTAAHTAKANADPVINKCMEDML